MIKKFIQVIKNILPAQQIIEEEMLRYAYSTDASLYRMLPKLVLIVASEDEVVAVIKAAMMYQVKLTFRAAGTSLSGQAITDQVLVMLSNSSWQQYKIHENGAKITLETGVIGASANKFLSKYNKQIGPDPGSINTAKIGGIIANNSSGMCCGTSKNSYATLVDMKMVFADGYVLDTSDVIQVEKFQNSHSGFISAIAAIREQIISDNELTKFIRKKFAIKNTSGYSLNAFLDYTDPIKIIERLMIGSEGTLGFVSQVTLKTVPNYEFKALNFIYGDLSDLINLTVQIAGLNISSIELLDYLSLQSVSTITELQPYLIQLTENQAAIMIELAEESQSALDGKIRQVQKIIDASKILQQIGFTQDEQIRITLWKARSGILPSVAGQRPLGSSVLIEDVAVYIQHLSELISDIRQMFHRYDYANAAIFGHVLAGNIHFVVTPNFTIPEELIAYDKFMHEFTALVANKYNGSLKAEHGSGRNISPFAVLEWGQKCWEIMWQIKHLFDPQNILNPDVKLTRDNTLHTKHLKQFASVDDEIDKCMECGFCEPVCPSRKLSLTPRQRNSVARKMTTLVGRQKAKWQKSFQYYGIDTCATTGMCKTVCPVGIDTGAFILRNKPEQSELINHTAHLIAMRKKVNLANTVASFMGHDNLQKISTMLHNKFKVFPIYLSNMPTTQLSVFNPSLESTKPIITLLPSCPNRIFSEVMQKDKYSSQLLLERLGYQVKYPEDITNQCCGQIYHSSCNHLQQKNSLQGLSNVLPHDAVAIIDNSSCAGFAKDNNLNIIDINQFLVAKIDRARITRRYNKIALHVDCSTAKHSFNPQYLEILKLCATEVIITDGIKCCGFAGDKGFNVPELNASSLSDLAGQVSDCEVGVTFNRNCQIGLSHHSSIEYLSLVDLLLYCIN